MRPHSYPALYPVGFSHSEGLRPVSGIQPLGFLNETNQSVIISPQWLEHFDAVIWMLVMTGPGFLNGVAML